ncbi:MAG: hypothetical protein A3G87_07640 [Omnitrophica bacterium RIFCSPLOWO2_12_FULL_50_11]|nr:MAG: hypothetical protein A3G87_07640 [Omnitrophica bacterium RIFCSPLOWO2_12_FULL_50_11]
MKRLKSESVLQGYQRFLGGIQRLLEEARHQVAGSVNAILTATYWEISRRVVEYEQKGRKRAEYGEAILENLSRDLTKKFGRGFSRQNLQQMREFYLSYPPAQIGQTLSRKSRICQTVSSKSRVSVEKSSTRLSKLDVEALAAIFPLSWSHYVRLLTVRTAHARKFYEVEALRGGWSVRQLDRQISSRFYERVTLSRNKAG